LVVINPINTSVPFLELYSIVCAAWITLWVGIVAWAAIRQRHVRNAPPPPEVLPRVSIVLAALNEEATIEPAMRSLLALEYPNLEIIAVDDRSTDRTGEILERLAAAHPGKLRVIHLDTLPDGWLGKCNALQHGSRAATGEWLLFTDADVIFAPKAILHSVSFATALGAGHFVLYPWMLWKDPVEASLLALFSMSLTVAFQTWRVESRSLRAFIGIGAFNMIRRDLYESFGGHSPLRLEVGDDIKLGYLAKKHGAKSVAVNSGGEVRVKWREGTRDTIRGLERSGFAGVNFNWTMIVLGVLFFTGIMVAPYVLPLLTDSALVHWLSVYSIVLILLAYASGHDAGGLPRWTGLLHPVACLLYSWAIFRSGVVTTRRGGLSWRGTFYSIDELKRGSVR
jgi:glycosyltransferase involved in cell wall biosynthesis